MTLPFRPLQDVVICVKKEAETVTRAGIVVPQMFDDQEEAEVIAVGPGKYTQYGNRVPPEVKPGDRILFNKHQVQALRFGSDEFLALREEHIRAIL
jgi:chaperonin GroES